MEKIKNKLKETKEKVVTFVKEHKEELTLGAVMVVVGGTIYALTKSQKKDLEELNVALMPSEPSEWEKKNRAYLIENYDAYYGNDTETHYWVPDVTKENAIKFLENEGNSYQIDRIDDNTAFVYVNNYQEDKED